MAKENPSSQTAVAIKELSASFASVPNAIRNHQNELPVNDFPEDAWQNLMHAIERLPELERLVFILHFYEEMSVEDIAGGIGMEIDATRRYLLSAVRHLKVDLSGSNSRHTRIM